jgi:hypothetical protein
MATANKTTKSLWIKNTAGQNSMSATFATIAFVVVTLAYIASIFEKIGPLTIRPFDAAACGVYLSPILMLYFGRRKSDGTLEVQSPTITASTTSSPSQPGA